jgi:hypothetical protein
MRLLEGLVTGNYPASGQKFKSTWPAYYVHLVLIVKPIMVYFSGLIILGDRLYGLLVRVPGYRSRDSGFDSRRYQIFWEALSLERGPLSLVSVTEELLKWKSSGSGLENREYGRGHPLCWPRDTLYPQKLALTLPTCGGRSIGIARLRTKTTELYPLD